MNRKLRQAASVLLLVSASGCFRAGDPREAIDGDWVPVSADTAPGASPTLRYALDEARLRMSSSDGRSYAADVDGPAAALEGAPQGTTVSVQQVPAVAYREVVMRDGRPVSVRLVTVADKRVAVIFENRLDGTAALHAALKQ